MKVVTRVLLYNMVSNAFCQVKLFVRKITAHLSSTSAELGLFKSLNKSNSNSGVCLTSTN